MSKLQLYIGESLPAYKDVLNVNPSVEIKRYIGDYRRALDLVEYDKEQSHTFFYVSYLNAGYLLAIVATISGSDTNHLSASVYIPYDIIIAGDELHDMLVSAAEILRGGKLDSESLDSLRDIFSHTYAEDDSYGMRAPSEGHNYGYVKYGGSHYPTLKAYADLGFYLPEFAQYAGILFVEEDDEGITGYHGTDMSVNELPALTVLEPPAEVPQGFTPHIFRHLFNVPFVVPKDKEISIVWRRSGFDNIVQKITVDGPDYTIPDIDVSGSTKSISPVSFYVTAQGSQEVPEGVSITVNGVPIDKPVNFAFKELSNAQVEITAPGYFPYSGRLDLASTTQALVQMRELYKVYRFDLPAHTPDPIDALHFTIHSKRRLDSSPIEGYTTSDGVITEGANRSNMLVYVGGQSRKSMIIALCTFVAGVLIGFFTGWLSFREEVSENDGELVAEVSAAAPAAEAAAEAAEQPTLAEAPAPATPSAADAPTNFDATAAKTYLDSHQVWRRSEMAEISGLEGLFDDMNNYNFERITGYWNERLSGSRSFDALTAAVRGSSTKRDPRTGNHTPTYNHEGDTAINWRGYTYWIDP